MFLVYVNNMTGVISYVSWFIDDAKLLRKMTNHKDCQWLPNDINKTNVKICQKKWWNGCF